MSSLNYIVNTNGSSNVLTWPSTTGPTGNNYYYQTTSIPHTTVNSSGSLKVTGDAEFDGEVKIQGRNITEMLLSIEKRLAILVPDPEKLEKFEALKKAYENYKMLEALCHLPDNTNEG